MAGNKGKAHWDDFARLLDNQADLHAELAGVVQNKIDAMRRADMQALYAGNEEERRLVERIQEREGLRKQMLDAIGRTLGMTSGVARALTVSDLMRRAPAVEGERISQAAQRLRKQLAQLAQVNSRATILSRELVHQLGCILAAATRPGEGSWGYAPSGTPTTVANVRIFDALG